MKSKISTTELYIIGFISSILFLASFTSNTISDKITDSLFSTFLAIIFGIILSFPLFLSKHKQVEKTPIDIIYAIYFFISDVIILTQIQNMFSNTIYPDVEPVFLGIFVLSVAAYGAYKGIQAVGRSSIFVFCFIIFCILLITFGSLSLLDVENTEVMFYTGYSDSIYNSLKIFARSSVLPQLVILYRYANKELGYFFYVWQGVTLVCIISVFTLIMYGLGRFANIQMFPFYCLTSVSSLGPIRRMDLVFSMMWISALIIRFATDLFLIKECIGGYINGKVKKYIVTICAVLIIFFSYIMLELGLMDILTLLLLYSPIFTIILGFLFPLINLLKERNK